MPATFKAYTVSIGIEDRLWFVADKLRNNVDAAEAGRAPMTVAGSLEHPIGNHVDAAAT